MGPWEIAPFNTALWPLFACVVLFLFGIWLGKRPAKHYDIWQRRETSPASPPPSKPAPSYDDVPTVRLSASQRIDRLHRVVTLSVATHVDLLDLTFDRIPRLRLALKGIEGAQGDTEFARIHIDLGGAVAGCGSLVKEVAVNEFLLPRAIHDEQRCSILHFHGQGDAVNFLRVKVLRFNAEQRSVELDVLHVCSKWDG